MSEELVISKPNEMMRYLEKAKGQMALCLPKHITPDRMLRLTLTCFSTNPALRRCTAQSIMASMVTGSQLGLEIGVRGQAFLVPYKNQCTLVPGWQGLVGLLNNTGRATAWTGAVFEGDTWEFELGSQPRCRHMPGKQYGMPDHLIWVYACGKVNGSEQPVIEAWPIERVLGHRDKFNKVGNKHYSYDNIEMYARKVVLLQVLKYMPCSTELTNAIDIANRVESGASSVIIDNGIVVEQQPETPSAAQSEPDDNVPMGEPRPAATADAPTPETEKARFAKAIRGLLPLSNLTEPEFLAFMVQNKALNASVTSLDAAPLAFLQSTHDQWAAIMGQYNKAKNQGWKLSPQAVIESAVLGAGLTFSQFNKVAEDQAWYPDATSVAGFSEIPMEAAARLVKQIGGIVQICKAASL